MALQSSDKVLLNRYTVTHYDGSGTRLQRIFYASSHHKTKDTRGLYRVSHRSGMFTFTLDGRGPICRLKCEDMRYDSVSVDNITAYGPHDYKMPGSYRAYTVIDREGKVHHHDCVKHMHYFDTQTIELLGERQHKIADYPLGREGQYWYAQRGVDFAKEVDTTQVAVPPPKPQLQEEIARQRQQDEAARPKPIPVAPEPEPEPVAEEEDIPVFFGVTFHSQKHVDAFNKALALLVKVHKGELHATN